MTTQIYDSSSIEVLTGLEPVRKRPGMYTQTESPNHLAQEVIDNSVDEVIAGHASRIRVTLHDDASLSVSDDGRGMPVDIHQDENLSGVEVIMTRLHAGAKFSTKTYMHSGGLHGVGVSVVNALSRRLEVAVKRNGVEYHMAFADGDAKENLRESGRVRKNDTGTSIRFWPDGQFFDTTDFSVSSLKRLLLAKAVLCPGLSIEYVDEIKPENDATWLFEDGLGDYLADQMNGSERIPEQPIIIKRTADESQVDWVVMWAPESEKSGIAESYVNLIPTEYGGTHVNGLRTGMADAVREFCEFRSLTPRGVRLTSEDVWRHCNYVLSVRMENPQFTGQTKGRLTSREIGKTVSALAKDAFSLWLNQHVKDAERIAMISIDNARARQRNSQQVARRKIGAGPALPGKLSDCSSTELEQTELFLVEGDSAGGSAKQARNREFQAVLPLRGKILNTWEEESADVLNRKVMHDIAVALGVDPGASDVSGLRYGKVCILADADPDGAHIATLLCALFLKHYRRLVEMERIYVAMPPLYRVDVGKEVHYALDDGELNALSEEIRKRKPNAKLSVQRFKGLGEMNPGQLKETAMNPDTRRLVGLDLVSPDRTCKTMNMLLSKNQAAERKTWLSDVGYQAKSL